MKIKMTRLLQSAKRNKSNQINELKNENTIDSKIKFEKMERIY